MKRILLLLALLLIPIFASAQENISIATGIIGGNQLLGARTSDNQTTVGILGIDSNGNTTIKSLSTKTVDFPGNVSQSGDTIYGVNAQPKFAAAAVITPAVTPLSTAVASNVMTGRYNLVATAAPTSGFGALPAATANVGESHGVYNQGANPFAIMPNSGDTINGLGATTPFSCATGKFCDCKGLTSALYQCAAV